jgi:hypothetical protein
MLLTATAPAALNIEYLQVGGSCVVDNTHSFHKVTQRDCELQAEPASSSKGSDHEYLVWIPLLLLTLKQSGLTGQLVLPTEARRSRRGAYQRAIHMHTTRTLHNQ